MNEPRKFYDMGYRAYDNKQSEDDNPAVREVNYNAWRYGWKQAEQDYLESQELMARQEEGLAND